MRPTPIASTHERSAEPITPRQPRRRRQCPEEAREHRDGVELHQDLIAAVGEHDQNPGRDAQGPDPPGRRVEPVRRSKAAGKQASVTRKRLEQARSSEIRRGSRGQQQERSGRLERGEQIVAARRPARDLGEQGRVLRWRSDASPAAAAARPSVSNPTTTTMSQSVRQAGRGGGPVSSSWSSRAIAFDGASTPVASAMPSGMARAADPAPASPAIIGTAGRFADRRPPPYQHPARKRDEEQCRVREHDATRDGRRALPNATATASPAASSDPRLGQSRARRRSAPMHAAAQLTATVSAKSTSSAPSGRNAQPSPNASASPWAPPPPRGKRPISS